MGPGNGTVPPSAKRRVNGRPEGDRPAPAAAAADPWRGAGADGPGDPAWRHGNGDPRGGPVPDDRRRPPDAPRDLPPAGPGGTSSGASGDPPPQIPTHSASLPLAVAAVGLLLVFVLVGWVLFQPSTFTQKLITFGVAAGLMVWVVSVVDGAQRRSLDRLQRRLEMQREKAVAEARAEERGKALEAFLDSFVVNVNGSVGKFPPSVYSYTHQGPEQPALMEPPRPAGPRPNPNDD